MFGTRRLIPAVRLVALALAQLRLLQAAVRCNCRLSCSVRRQHDQSTAYCSLACNRCRRRSDRRLLSRCVSRRRPASADASRKRRRSSPHLRMSKTARACCLASWHLRERIKARKRSIRDLFCLSLLRSISSRCRLSCRRSASPTVDRRTSRVRSRAHRLPPLSHRQTVDGACCPCSRLTSHVKGRRSSSISLRRMSSLPLHLK